MCEGIEVWVMYKVSKRTLTCQYYEYGYIEYGVYSYVTPLWVHYVPY